MISNGYLSKDKFKISIESYYRDGKEIEENIFQLPPELLKERKIDVLDVSEGINPKDSKYTEDEVLL